ncbi:MAG: NUDIX hydrolase [Chloroflexi bacterium]|nr:NUDIX hydrolase [Chloroflexota bacterium]
MMVSNEGFQPLKTERLASETIFQGEKITLRVDTLRMGNRTPSKKEIIVHPGSAVMIPITDRGTVLLVKQWRAAQGCYTLELPSGTRDGDEAPEVTADRELREETGYRASRFTPIGGFVPVSGYSEEYCHGFVATGLEVDPLPQDKLEDIMVVETTVGELRRMCMNGDIDDALTIAAVTRAYDILDDARSTDV